MRKTHNQQVRTQDWALDMHTERSVSWQNFTLDMHIKRFLKEDKRHATKNWQRLSTCT